MNVTACIMFGEEMAFQIILKNTMMKIFLSCYFIAYVLVRVLMTERRVNIKCIMTYESERMHCAWSNCMEGAQKTFMNRFRSLYLTFSMAISNLITSKKNLDCATSICGNKLMVSNSVEVFSLNGYMTFYPIFTPLSLPRKPLCRSSTENSTKGH